MTFAVSQSGIKCWRRCRKQYEYRYFRNLEARAIRRPLAFGKITHSMLDAHFKGRDPWKVLREAKKSQGKMFKDEEALFDSIVDQIQELMENYFNFYKKDDFKVLGAEIEGKVPLVPADNLREEIVYSLKIDLLTEDNREKVGLWDHKTGAQSLNIEQQYSELQSMLYAWAAPLLGFPKVNYIIWNHMKSKAPRRPDELKDGTLSKAVKQSTTWYTYKKAIEEGHFKLKHYKDMKKKLDGKEADFFHRFKLPVNKKLQAQLVKEAQETARDMYDEHERDGRYFGNTGEHNSQVRTMDKHCDWCDYKLLCNAELRGYDTEDILSHDYQKRKKKKKVKKKSKKKKHRGKVSKS